VPGAWGWRPSGPGAIQTPLESRHGRRLGACQPPLQHSVSALDPWRKPLLDSSNPDPDQECRAQLLSPMPRSSRMC
jgi:hypothetical protein